MDGNRTRIWEDDFFQNLPHTGPICATAPRPDLVPNLVSSLIDHDSRS
jgi:hypothetical protein